MQKREVWKVVVFGLISLGIYDIVWLYKTRKEMVARGAQIPPIKILLLPIASLLLMVIVALAYGAFAYQDINTTGGITTNSAQIISTLAVIFNMVAFLAIIPLSIWWWYKYSKAVAQVTNGQMSFDTTFWLGILLSFLSVSFVMPGLIQENFNRVGDGLSEPTPASALTE